MFVLDPQALGSAAGRIADAAGSLSCLDVASPFRTAGEALPGSATLASCGWISSEVEAGLDVWAEHLLDLCETARLVAHDAAETDQAVADALRAATP